MASVTEMSFSTQISALKCVNEKGKRFHRLSSSPYLSRLSSGMKSGSVGNGLAVSARLTESNERADPAKANGPLDLEKSNSSSGFLSNVYKLGETSARRKTKIVGTIGPSTNTREMIWKLAEAGMNVARLNMSHGDHASHQKTIDFVKEYNAQSKDNVIAIMLDTKGPEVRSGDLPQPILLKEGQEFNFTIKRGVNAENTVSVNYDDFVNDVEVGDVIFVDGGMMSLVARSKTADLVKCEVIDGGELTSRRHLNVRGKSATLPSITERDWDDIKFGVDNEVDFYAVSFIKDAKVVHELKDYLKICGASIHVIVKIESADAIPNLHSIISASDGAMVARGDLGAELPIEEVPLLQEDIITRCRGMGKPVIVATNMLESMIDHPTPTRAEVSDISIAVREGADAIMLSGETAHGKYPLKAVKVMHTVALKTEAMSSHSIVTPGPASDFKLYQSHLSTILALHATTMANTLGTAIIVFTRTGSMATLLSHYRPSSIIFAFTNEERVKQRLALYHGVLPVYMEFSDDAEETFSRALNLALSQDLLKEGEHVTLVQSGRQRIWRRESTHHIEVRKVQCNLKCGEGWLAGDYWSSFHCWWIPILGVLPLHWTADRCGCLAYATLTMGAGNSMAWIGLLSVFHDEIEECLYHVDNGCEERFHHVFHIIGNAFVQPPKMW